MGPSKSFVCCGQSRYIFRLLMEFHDESDLLATDNARLPKHKRIFFLCLSPARLFQVIPFVELTAKLFYPELYKRYFLYIHKQICSKVPISFYFVGPKCPSGNCYVSCFLTDKTALTTSHYKGTPGQDFFFCPGTKVQRDVPWKP